MYHRKVPPHYRRPLRRDEPLRPSPVFKHVLKDIASALQHSDSAVLPRARPILSAEDEESQRERRREIEAALDIALRETDQQPVFRLSYEKELVRLVMRGETEPDAALMSLFGLFDES